MAKLLSKKQNKNSDTPQAEVLGVPTKARFFRRARTWVGIGILAVLGILASSFFLGTSPLYTELSTSPVVKGTLTETVQETGTVVPDLSISYAFATGGMIETVAVSEGDMVQAGDVLASLHNTQQRARLTQAQAALSSAQAALNLRLAPPSEEQKEEAQAKIAQMKAQLAQQIAQAEKVALSGKTAIAAAEQQQALAKNNLQSLEMSTQGVLVRDAYDALATTIKTTFPAITKSFSVLDAFLGVEQISVNDSFENFAVQYFGTYESLQKTYTQFLPSRATVQSSVNALNPGSAEATIDAVYASQLSLMNSLQSLLSKTHTFVTSLNNVNGLTQSEIAAFISTISAQETALGSAHSALVSAFQFVGTQKNVYSAQSIAYDQATLSLQTATQQAAVDIAIAEAQIQTQQALVDQAILAYNTLVAAPRQVDIGALQAEVARTRAAVQAATDELSLTTLTALEDGVVSRVFFEQSEIVQPGTVMLAVLSEGLSIDVDISESDISKVSAGDTAVLRFDAISDSEFRGSVVSIQPSETQISGVVYYKTKISFDPEQDLSRILPGMTVDVQIITQEIPDTLMVPQRAILEDEHGTFVRVFAGFDEAYREVPVEVGIRGDDGVRQILSGLSGSEEVITFIKLNP